MRFQLAEFGWTAVEPMLLIEGYRLLCAGVFKKRRGCPA